MEQEKPYILKAVAELRREYNPKFGDDRICKCGHPYYRHFDSYEQMDPCGCKYCGCYTFEEAMIQNEVVVISEQEWEDSPRLVMYKTKFDAGILVPFEYLTDLARTVGFAIKHHKRDENGEVDERLNNAEAFVKDAERLQRERWPT